MNAISPTALSNCLVALQVAGIVGVWFMRIAERTDFAHSLRGIVMLLMLLLGITLAATLLTQPRAAIAGGFVLALMAVMAVVDFRRPENR